MFCTHLLEWKLITKAPFFCTFFSTFFFFQICLHKVSQNAWKMYLFQDGFSPCFARIYQSENCLQKCHFLHVFFFKFVSTKFFKTHVNCIHFKTVFAPVLYVFTNVRIAHKNAVFCTFFFLILSPESVWKHMQNELISKQFSYVFCTHMPKWKLLTKTLIFVRFFSNLSQQINSKRIKKYSFHDGFWTCSVRIYQCENCQKNDFFVQRFLQFFFFFFYLCPQSVSKCMQNAFISKQFFHVFWTHWTKKIAHKDIVFCTFYFKLISKKFLKTHAKSINFKTVSASVLHAFTKVGIAYKNAVLTLFFLLVSTKFLKTHAKCIHFKTVFARVLHAFNKVKIVQKNEVFSSIFLKNVSI